jgi:hypothetical protein
MTSVALSMESSNTKQADGRGNVIVAASSHLCKTIHRLGEMSDSTTLRSPLESAGYVIRKELVTVKGGYLASKPHDPIACGRGAAVSEDGFFPSRYLKYPQLIRR